MMTVRVLVLLGVAGLVVLDRRAAVPPATGQIALSDALAQMAMVMALLLVCWVLLAWMAGVLRASPGWIGQAADVGWRLLVPAAIRIGLVAAVGIPSVCGVASAVPASQDAVASSTTTYPAVARPDTGVPPQADPVRAKRAAAVTVRPGDSLWLIAERWLGEQTSPAEVAEEWPRWYQQNRAVIGPDPDLLIVGTALTPPAGGTR